MKKFLKITLLIVLTAGIIGTFVLLWMKSRNSKCRDHRPPKDNSGYG